MAISESSAIWKGNLIEGNGSLRLGSGAYAAEIYFPWR
jgi:hypothetical protein